MLQNHNQNESGASSPRGCRRLGDPALWSVVAGIIGVALILSTSRKGWEEWHLASETIRNFGLAGAGLLAATVGVYLAWKRTTAAVHQTAVAAKKEAREAEDSKESLYTELFTKAIEQLTHENLSIRLGGIYALERISKEFPKNHWPIMEILAAYIRNTTASEAKDGSREDDATEMGDVQAGNVLSEKKQRYPVETQAIMNAFLSRSRSHDKGWIDLQESDLAGVVLAGVDLEGINLGGSVLDGADLTGSVLSKANLTRASLKKARMEKVVAVEVDFSGANLSGAALDGADLSQARGEYTQFSGSSLRKTSLERSCWRNASFNKALLTEGNLRKAIFEGCFFANAMLLQSNINGAQFPSSRLWGAQLNSLAGSSNVSFHKASLKGASMEDVEFRECNFYMADLRGLWVVNVSFVGANLNAAIIDEYLLSEIKGIGGNQLEKIKLTNGTGPKHWPEIEIDIK